MKTVNNYSKYIFIKLISLLIVYSFFLISCENDLEVIKTITAISDLPKQTAEDIEVIYSDSAKLQMKIVAPKLELYQKTTQDAYYEFNKGIIVYFYKSDQAIKSKLSADYAIYYESKSLWEARNDVIAINESGEILKTEQLFWDQEKKRIYTDKFAKVIDNKSEIQGKGFEADENFTNWEFKKVTGIINIEKTE